MSNIDKRKLNLWQKICAVQSDMTIFAGKNAKNEFDKYHYRDINSLLAALKPKLGEYGLVVMAQDLPVSEMNLQIKEGSTAKGGRNVMISYMQKFAIIDAETGNRETFNHPVIAENKQSDKASGSADTYVLKYVLGMWGLLPDKDLDPDTTENTRQLNEQSKQRPVSRPVATKMADPSQHPMTNQDLPRTQAPSLVPLPQVEMEPVINYKKTVMETLRQSYKNITTKNLDGSTETKQADVEYQKQKVLEDINLILETNYKTLNELSAGEFKEVYDNEIFQAQLKGGAKNG